MGYCALYSTSTCLIVGHFILLIAKSSFFWKIQYHGHTTCLIVYFYLIYCVLYSRNSAIEKCKELCVSYILAQKENSHLLFYYMERGLLGRSPWIWSIQFWDFIKGDVRQIDLVQRKMLRSRYSKIPLPVTHNLNA